VQSVYTAAFTQGNTLKKTLFLLDADLILRVLVLRISDRHLWLYDA
jgi:hypothetical protein